MNNSHSSIGYIVSGSLADGLMVRIASRAPRHALSAGKFVVIRHNEETYFSLITDLALGTTHQDIILFPPHTEDALFKSALAEHNVYLSATIKPMLMLVGERLMPVKMVPPHFSSVFEANAADVARVFGSEQDNSHNYFKIGTPLDMTTPVCLDLERFCERSNGVFGKTGTGKTFLTRLVVAGLINNDKAVALIFDMHSEYGLQARKEKSEGPVFVKGLKTLFGDKVAIFSLDPASTRRRGGSPDCELRLSLQSINVEDIISLQEELNLHPTACEAAYLIAVKYKHDWLSTLLAHGDNLKQFSQELGAHPESIAALYRKLKVIESLPFLGAHNDHDVMNLMMEYIDRGISIIVEFGNYSSTLTYLLIANIITRRLHTLYIQKTEKFLGSQRAHDEPKKLMIVIEEAHKFLNPQTARQTIFGTIAREMRKYYVSLLVVDQRPSGIDPEIVSQLGTKIVAQLTDERDIAATLAGSASAQSLRSIVASLDSKKQVVLMGHAVAMPVVIETRSYDEIFYASLQGIGTKIQKKDLVEFAKELF